MKAKNVFRIFDKNTGKYIQTGSYRKKHSYLVFPFEAIKASNIKGDNYEVHEFETKPFKIYDLNKKEIL